MPSWFSRSRSHNEVPPVNDPPAPSGGGYSGGNSYDGSNYGGRYPNTQDGDEDKARRELFAGAPNRPADAASLNPPPSYRSNPGTPQQPPYNQPHQSPYNQPQQPLPQQPRGEPDRYARNAAIGDKYSRGYGNVDNDRAELFAGHQPAQPRRRFNDDDNQPREMTAEDEDEEVEGIKSDMRQVKQESVNSTRNALRIAREAEETARNTLSKLGDQSEKIANTERHLDLAKGSTNRAEDRTDELKQLNRSIFRPVIVFNKDSKRAREEQRLADRHEQERLEREAAALDVRETQGRLGRAAASGQRSGGGDDNYGDGEEGISTGRRLAPEQQRARQAARSRYQFEATASDDELEDELDDNLDEIHDVSKRLKDLATSMGTEVDAQNSRLDRVTGKTDHLDTKITRATDRLKRIK